MPAGSSGGLRVPTRCDRSTLGSARLSGHRRPGTQSPTCASRRRCDMFDVQKTAPGVGRCGQHRSHVASPAARCGPHAGTRHGRGSDRVDRQVRVGDQPKERTLMSSRRWSPRIGKHEAATGRRSPVNQNGRDIGGLLPTGTVTLLAADVDSSSLLWEADPDEMMSTAPPAGRIPQDPRLFRHPHSPDNDATAGVKSMAVDPCASRPVIGTQHCLSGQRNRVPVAVIPTTNPSSSAIRSSHRALGNSRRGSTRGRGRASWGTK
jgi:hypothetical protein